MLVSRGMLESTLGSLYILNASFGFLCGLHPTVESFNSKSSAST